MQIRWWYSRFDFLLCGTFQRSNVPIFIFVPLLAQEPWNLGPKEAELPLLFSYPTYLSIYVEKRCPYPNWHTIKHNLSQELSIHLLTCLYWLGFQKELDVQIQVFPLWLWWMPGWWWWWWRSGWSEQVYDSQHLQSHWQETTLKINIYTWS